MITVIIPIYNVKPYLETCLQSVANQSYTDFECLLIDDGSTDGSSEICDKWAQKDSRFHVFHQTNQGVSAARNKGIEMAKGEFLYFIDADDWCESNIFKYIINEYELIIGTYYTVNDQGKKIQHFHKPTIYSNYALAYLKEEIQCCIGSFIVKTDLIRRECLYYNIYHKYGEDMDFILRLLLSSKNTYITDNVFVNYRITEVSAMGKSSLDRYDVFYSRLELKKYAEMKGYMDVKDYIQYFSCAEAVITITRELLRKGYSCNLIKNFIFCNRDIINTLEEAFDSTLLSAHLKYSAWFILHNIQLYKLYINAFYRYYDIRGKIGLLKQKLLR